MLVPGKRRPLRQPKIPVLFFPCQNPRQIRACFGSSSFPSSTTRGPGEKGAPRNHQQKFRLRNWPISSADFPMTPMQGTPLVRRRILGQYPAAPCSPGPLGLLLILPKRKLGQISTGNCTKLEIPAGNRREVQNFTGHCRKPAILRVRKRGSFGKGVFSEKSIF